jgi:hypothetical protein
MCLGDRNDEERPAVLQQGSPVTASRSRSHVR